jgi:hypothetical protein
MSLTALTKTIKQLRQGFNKLSYQLKKGGFLLDTPEITSDGHIVAKVMPCNRAGVPIDKSKVLFKVRYLEDADGGYSDITFLLPGEGNRGIEPEKHITNVDEFHKRLVKFTKDHFPEVTDNIDTFL